MEGDTLIGKFFSASTEINTNTVWATGLYRFIAGRKGDNYIVFFPVIEVKQMSIKSVRKQAGKGGLWKTCKNPFVIP